MRKHRQFQKSEVSNWKKEAVHSSQEFRNHLKTETFFQRRRRDFQMSSSQLSSSELNSGTHRLLTLQRDHGDGGQCTFRISEGVAQAPYSAPQRGGQGCQQPGDRQGERILIHPEQIKIELRHLQRKPNKAKCFVCRQVCLMPNIKCKRAY